MRALGIDAQAIAELDKVLHEPARLALMGCLYVVEDADFVFLQSQTGMTGGNLSSHIRKLAEVDYLQVEKGFNGARPQTTLRLTAHGRRAFAKHVERLRAFLAAIN